MTVVEDVRHCASEELVKSARFFDVANFAVWAKPSAAENSRGEFAAESDP